MKQKEQKLDKLRYSQDEFEYYNIVRAGNDQIEEKFAALQTLLTKMASRFDRFDNSICQ